MSSVSADAPESAADLTAPANGSRGAPAGAASGANSASTDFGPNEWLVDELYQRYQADPGSVDRAWWSFFADYEPSPDAISQQQPASTTPAAATPAAATPPAAAPPAPAAAPAAPATAPPPAASSQNGSARPAASPSVPARPTVPAPAPSPAPAPAPSAVADSTGDPSTGGEHSVRLRGA